MAVVPELDALGVVDALPSQCSARSYSTSTDAHDPIIGSRGRPPPRDARRGSLRSPPRPATSPRPSAREDIARAERGRGVAVGRGVADLARHLPGIERVADPLVEPAVEHVGRGPLRRRALTRSAAASDDGAPWTVGGAAISARPTGARRRAPRAPRRAGGGPRPAARRRRRPRARRHRPGSTLASRKATSAASLSSMAAALVANRSKRWPRSVGDRSAARCAARTRRAPGPRCGTIAEAWRRRGAPPRGPPRGGRRARSGARGTRRCRRPSRQPRRRSARGGGAARRAGCGRRSRRRSRRRKP